ncbi:MAG TPA: hypothetical protein PLP17_17720, partial [Oligoflexia bacterium]|nr:hypothetical protein [Oligoflexia bacterium]
SATGDLANWSTHLSKIRAAYLLNSRWQADSSLIVYWGYPGASDYADYLNSLRAPQAALTDNGYDEASELSAYLSAGLQYRIHQTLTLRLDGYNLLGIFEDSLNKRLFVNRTYEYRAHAPSAAVSLRWSF